MGTGTIIWIIVSGFISGICIALMIVGLKLYFSNVHGDGKAYMKDFVGEDGMQFLKKIDL
ncbi:MAG: hypothetical protein II994_09715 [Lachnospiraceae bacterium]|nr:hypothetical protein [Lachnospiraceae bacterium]